jgi:Leucine-rich repeat (LRR) protein
LDSVPEGTFNGVEHLAQLRLKHNRICKLPSYVLLVNHRLIVLIFRKALNEIKGSLELLDLGFNCLESVPASNLRSAVFLKHLDLSNNRISALKDLEFMNLPELKEVRLSDNRISQLSSRAFVNVPSLTHLYLRGNELTVVDPNVLQSFKHLIVIDLALNRLPKVCF